MHFALGLTLVLAITLLFIMVAFPEEWGEMVNELKELKQKINKKPDEEIK